MAAGRVQTVEIPECGCTTPGTTNPATCYCGVQDLLRIIRRRYSLSVLSAIQTTAPARYHDIAAAVPSASSSTLVETLQALETAQLITRQPATLKAPQPTYSLRASGAKLLSRLRRLLDEVQGS